MTVRARQSRTSAVSHRTDHDHSNPASLARILIVDDEPAQMRALCRALRSHCYETTGLMSGKDALTALRESRFDLLLTDLMMPGMDGIELLAEALKIDPQLAGVLMTGSGSIATAVQAMQTGALDYMVKPVKLSALLPVLARALTLQQLRRENIFLQEGLRHRTSELEAAQQQLVEANAVLEHRVELRTAALRDYAGKLRRLSHRLFETEEAERRHLARELHDRVGQNISVLNMTIGMLRTELPAAAQAQVSARFNDCETLLHSIGDLVRNVMADLRPVGLDELGLYAALAEYAHQVHSRGMVPVRLAGAELEQRLPAAAEITLFRIAQEGIINALKHAVATEITLTLNSDADTATLIIADNGRGFHLASASRQAMGHLGMLNMRERAESIGGRLRVESAPSEGTRLIVQVPRCQLAYSG